MLVSVAIPRVYVNALFKSYFKGADSVNQAFTMPIRSSKREIRRQSCALKPGLELDRNPCKTKSTRLTTTAGGEIVRASGEMRVFALGCARACWFGLR